ncbi:hypothetical protein [Desulfitobacterium hafniense]|nr:hypothetical protein [Desulfitobacterium hafniense]MEA5022890.1 hypothetical protein [Desulfitobacterium hafniense]
MPEALFGIEYALCYPRHTPAGSPANEGFQLFQTMCALLTDQRPAME